MEKRTIKIQGLATTLKGGGDSCIIQAQQCYGKPGSAIACGNDGKCGDDVVVLDWYVVEETAPMNIGGAVGKGSEYLFPFALGSFPTGLFLLSLGQRNGAA